MTSRKSSRRDRIASWVVTISSVITSRFGSFFWGAVLISPSPLKDVSKVLLLLLTLPLLPPPNIVGGGAKIAEIARARDGNAARAGAAAVVQSGSCDRRYLNSCSRRDIDEEVDADEDDNEVLCERTVDGTLGSDAEDEN